MKIRLEYIPSPLVFSTIFWLTLAKPASPQIVLSEIMFNPAYNDNFYEFVEIYNISADSVNLIGWRLGDNSGDDLIIPHDEGLIIAPRQYGLIIDPQYFENPPYYDIPDECLTLTVESATLGGGGLSNSTPETISITDSTGNIIAQFTYSIEITPGHSQEKIDLSGGDNPANWGESENVNGSPGMINSIAPDSLDISLLSISVEPASLRRGDTAVLSVAVKNTGLTDAAAVPLNFAVDIDGNQLFSGEEVFFQYLISPLNVNDSEIVQCETAELVEGVWLIGAFSDFPDDDLTDDTISVDIIVGSISGAMLINEVMYYPQAGECEWVEIVNVSGYPLELSGWKLSDSDTLNAAVVEDSIIMLNGEFAVLAQDSTIFEWDIPAVSPVIILPGWRTLNDNGDAVNLIDLAGNIIDKVEYPAGWGGIETGISMERISLYSAASDLNNWYGCTAIEGSTPGRANSVHTENIPAETVLNIEPEVFTPDGDGANEIVMISYNLPMQTARVTIKIFDVRGRVVRTLMSGESSSPQKTIIWDGKDDDGGLCRIGYYIVYLEALEELSRSLMKKKASVVLGGKL